MTSGIRPWRSVQPARLELPLPGPELRRHLGFVAAHLFDETLGVDPTVARAAHADGASYALVGRIMGGVSRQYVARLIADD